MEEIFKTMKYDTGWESNIWTSSETISLNDISRDTIAKAWLRHFIQEILNDSRDQEFIADLESIFANKSFEQVHELFMSQTIFNLLATIESMNNQDALNYTKLMMA